jgi:predicted MFS family arabinose efflux permease
VAGIHGVGADGDAPRREIKRATRAEHRTDQGNGCLFLLAPRGGEGTLIVTRDAALVCAAGGLRAAAISLVGVLIVIHLASRGLSVGAIGLVIGTGIAASAAGTIITALRADRWGRRRTLVVLSLLSAAGYAALAFTAALPVLLLIAAAAMLNGLGMRAIDGRALTFALCAIVVGASAIPYVLLGPHVEQAVPASGFTNDAVDPRTRAVVRRIAGLFAIDSIGGGFLSSALVAYWFFERYGTTEVQLAYLFFAARILNVVSHLAAAWIARRIGLVNTMVLTHLPSSVFMMLAPAAPTAAVAAAFFLAREALVEMDVPTRQSYVLAVVPPSARTYASGMTNVTRNAGWAVGPLIGGSVMQHLSLAAPLFIGGTLKIVYDIALYRSFRHLKAPEEVT